MPRKNAPRAATRRGSPPLGNGREDSLSDEELGKLSRGNGPESQGAYAEEDYGAVEQGAYGDEDFDASYQRDGAVAASVDPDVAVSAEDEPSDEHAGPGRGLRGGEWVRPEPSEPPDELARKVLEEERDERRRDDLAVWDDVVDVLATALPAIRDLRVEVVRGRVALDGVVPERSVLSAAEDLASQVPGVVDVVSRLRVEPS
jgi:hypothetical protein